MENVTLKTMAVIGAGGFAREVAWLIRELNQEKPAYNLLGFIVSDTAAAGDHDSKVKVLGDFGWLDSNPVDCLAMGIGAPAVRLHLAEELKLKFPAVAWPRLIHPSFRHDAASATIEEGVVICAGVIGTVNLVIERFAMINLACTIGHEAHIGAGCVVNPSVNLSGGVTLKKGVLVGTGAQILQNLTIGAGASVGAGAVVTKNVAPGDTVVGMPAKPIKKEPNHA